MGVEPEYEDGDDMSEEDSESDGELEKALINARSLGFWSWKLRLVLLDSNHYSNSYSTNLVLIINFILVIQTNFNHWDYIWLL